MFYSCRSVVRSFGAVCSGVCLLCLCVSFPPAIPSSTVSAQLMGSPKTPKAQQRSQEKSQAEESDQARQLTYSEPTESQWQFGLKVNSTGASRQISCTVPIPMSWPEQQIEIVEEQRTDNVSRFRQTNPTPYTRQFAFSIPSIAAGGSETGLIQFRIQKRNIIAPQSTDHLVIPKKLKSALKQFLKPSPYIESTNKRIKKIATELWDDDLKPWAQAEANYRWVRATVKYKFDTQIHTCLDALDAEQGDCEELSSLFIAICRAQGIPARAVWVPGHTYPEFYFEDEAGEGMWYPCQAAGNYEFGTMTESRPILQKGDRFRIPGNREKVRYIMPTLVARKPEGEVTIDWVSKKLPKAETSKK